MFGLKHIEGRPARVFLAVGLGSLEQAAARQSTVELEAVELEAVELEAVELEAVEIEAVELEAVLRSRGTLSTSSFSMVVVSRRIGESSRTLASVQCRLAEGE